jgi:D-glucosaminate-6-phosphate ammonia-lyase
LGITGQEVEKILLDTEPRIVLGGASGNRRQSLASTLTIMPYMMNPGDDQVVAERLYAVLSRPPQIQALERPAPAVNVTGQWEARLEFVLGAAAHTFIFEQQGADLVGTHHGETLSSDLRGSVEGNEIRFRSSHRYEGTRIGYEFAGTVSGDRLEGTVGLDEYGQARFTAQRHRYGQPGGVVRPVKNV